MEKFTLTVNGIEDGQPIAERFAYGAPDGHGRIKDAGNVSPELRWSGVPAAAKSFVVIVVDPDVPASFELANKPGKTIPVDFPRRNFYHWVLIDIPATITHIARGADSHGVVSGGKPAGRTPYGVNGLNDYPGGGYDGPCPPWNDERLHHYHYQVFALDVASLGLTGEFTGPQVEAALNDHILAKAEVIGTYSNNPAVLGK